MSGNRVHVYKASGSGMRPLNPLLRNSIRTDYTCILNHIVTLLLRLLSLAVAGARPSQSCTAPQRKLQTTTNYITTAPHYASTRHISSIPSSPNRPTSKTTKWLSANVLPRWTPSAKRHISNNNAKSSSSTLQRFVPQPTIPTVIFTFNFPNKSS